MDDMNHTTSKENNTKGVPLSSYEYTNWKKFEPNNNMGCSESHVSMGSDTANLGKWYDTNAHQYVKYLPLCENTNHENPIHDHQCDTTFSNCWYEQCRNTDVGQDDSKCWSKKNSTSTPKCSESATPKYTELEMKYDGEVYVEYTCCDDNDDSGREKHGKCYDDSDDDPRLSNGAIVGVILAATFVVIVIICVPLFFFVKILKKQYEQSKNINDTNDILDTEAKVDSSLSADISSKNIPDRNQSLMNKPVDHVHAMLARCLKKDKTFRKYMDKVDKDESGSLNPKEWRKLLAKLKKKDHASDSWELTPDIVKSSFKVVLASTKSNDDELTYAGLQAWVIAETEAKVDSSLSTDISSWGRNERNRSVIVHPQVKAPDEVGMRREAREKRAGEKREAKNEIDREAKEKREAVIFQSRNVKIQKDLVHVSTNGYNTVCGRRYTGELDENGIANGLGTMKYSGGAQYKGLYKDDKRHGQGIQYFRDGSVYYEGEWCDGRRLHPPYPGYYSESCVDCEGCCVPDVCREKNKRPILFWRLIGCLVCLFNVCSRHFYLCLIFYICGGCKRDENEDIDKRDKRDTREDRMQREMYLAKYCSHKELQELTKRYNERKERREERERKAIELSFADGFS